MNHKQIVGILETNGWRLEKIRGSHWQMVNDDFPGVKATVPNHGAKDIAVGTVKSIEKQTGLKLLPRPQKKK